MPIVGGFILVELKETEGRHLFESKGYVAKH